MPVCVVPSNLEDYLRIFGQRAPFLKEPLAGDVKALTQDLSASNYLANAWRMSALAYNGMPVEFTTSTLKPEGLACTIDPFLKRPGLRLDINALVPFYEVAIHGAFAAGFEQMQAMQEGANLQFGAWIGLKYGPKGKKVKVYAEVPDGTTSWASFLPEVAAFHLKDLGLKLLMIGFYPDDARSGMEYYFDWPTATIQRQSIVDVMAACGVENWASKLLELLEQAALFCPEPGVFPPTTYGFSLACGATGQLEVFSLFTVTSTFFGGHAGAGIQSILDHYGWKMPLLEAVAEAGLEPQHNVIGFSVAADGRLGLNTTFSPSNKRFDVRLLPEKRPAEQPPASDLERLLAAYQLDNGAFPAYVQTPDKTWHPDANAFVTAQVLRCLINVQAAQSNVEKALDYLSTCQVAPHKYAFWPKDQHPAWMYQERLAPDVDDTAIITEVLYHFGRIGMDEVEAAITEMNPFCLTKLPDNRASWLRRGVYKTWMDHLARLNLVDCCANTNVLILLALAGHQGRIRYEAILQMIRAGLEWASDDYNRLVKLTPYYAHPAEWLRTLEYANENGVEELSPILDRAKTIWDFPPVTEATPLYCRHDGYFIWTSPCLAQVRQALQPLNVYQ